MCATIQSSRPPRTVSAPPPKQETQVVVGNGMVGQRLVELCADKLAERGASDQVDIVSFCEERLAAYNRVRLTSWFETRDADDLSLVGSYKDAPQGEWYASEERPNCKVRVGDLATGLDVDKKTVACGDELVSYDKCVLATGSYPFVPPIPGKDLPGVFVYRTIDDLEALVAYQKAHGARAAQNLFFVRGDGAAAREDVGRVASMARPCRVAAAGAKAGRVEGREDNSDASTPPGREQGREKTSTTQKTQA
jgi:NADPH-dependent 2,4-dienoyl-CoA reductase/sulfur reductase-like enzyme